MTIGNLEPNRFYVFRDKLLGDCNNGWEVNQTDLNLFRVHSPPAPYNAAYDLNRDGRIHWLDADIFFFHWTG